HRYSASPDLHSFPTRRSSDLKSYLYCKEVDANSFRYYRDQEPYDYGYGAIIENPYGFVPAVWIKHMDVGGDHGSPAIAGSFGKIDRKSTRLNSSHVSISYAVF